MPRSISWRAVNVGVKTAAWLLVLCMLVGASSVLPETSTNQVRRFTRAQEFDFAGWTLVAVGAKFVGWSVARANYLPEAERPEMVLQYMDWVSQASELTDRLAGVYGDASLSDPTAAAAELTQELQLLRQHQDQVQTIIEDVLEEQVGVVLDQIGLDLVGQPFPPVLFHFTRVPMALVVSPRQVIRQDANIQLNADLALEQQVLLEQRVEAALDVSALVVPVGGIGTYPTMVQQTSALGWLVDTIAHEWIHNYLTLRPLGMSYDVSEELRTMNETTASIAGREIGRLVLERYYPALVPPPPTEESTGESTSQAGAEQAPVFDYRSEMHQTRVTVDRLLQEGGIQEAEGYMEERRQVFWQQGYRIRRLNQAFFAFYGAYADEPIGPAGEDPVGAAVRQLWQRMESVGPFLRAMARMNEFSDLEAALNAQPTIR